MFQLTTPDFQTPDGRTIHRETVGLKWDRVIDAEQCVLHEQLDIQYFGYEAVDFPLTMRFRAGFEDVFEIRGAPSASQRQALQARLEGQVPRVFLRGGDRIRRSLAVRFYPLPTEVKGRHRPVRMLHQAERDQADPHFAPSPNRRNSQTGSSHRRACTEICMSSPRASRRPPSNG